MSKYSITKPDAMGLVRIEDTENRKVFNGYDFMGSIIWEDFGGHTFWMEPEEAEQVIRDLGAAEVPAEKDPADKQYLVKTTFGGEPYASIKTGRQVADLYETDQIAGGIYDSIDVWDIEGEPKKVNLLDLVGPILENKHWMEREYRDYCDNERY